MQRKNYFPEILNSSRVYLGCICLVYILFVLKFFDWFIDDLYIYFRYVNNFVSGEGIVFNKGTHVEGFSSFSWFLILSIFGLLKLPLEFFSKLTGIIFCLLNTFLVYKICERFKTGTLSLIACAMTILSLPFLLWSVSGFEIMFYTFLLLSIFFRVTQPLLNESLSVTSLLIFLISLSRPEGILFSLTFIIIIFIQSESKVYSFKIFSVYIILLALFLMFRFFYFGDLLPNTYYAKIGHEITGSYEFQSYKNGFFYILFFFKDNPQFLVPVILIPFVYKNLKQNRFYLFVIFIILIQFVFIIFSGGDWMIHYRFIVPVIPFLSIAAVITVREFFAKYNSKRIFYHTGILFLFLIIVLNLLLSDYNTIVRETVLWNNVKKVTGEINKEIPSGELAAIGASGIIPYYLNGISFIDIVGLNEKYIAKNGYRHGTWFEKSLPGYVYEKNPGWLIMWKRKDSSGKFTFENANPCYLDMSADKNFEKYHLIKTYDVSPDDRIELYKLK